MHADGTLKYHAVLSIAILLGSCAVFDQPKDVALIREPGQRHYGPSAHISESARQLWEYAVLSAKAYLGAWKKMQNEGQTTPPANLEFPSDGTDPYVKACASDAAVDLPLQGWTKWPDFPSERLKKEAEELGLYVEISEKTATPHTIAVVFMGTQFESWLDWKSNLRWFARFIPGYQDQYTLTAKSLGAEFVEEIGKRKPALPGADKSTVRIVTTGHSLGGGLAQFFAYSLPPQSSSGTKTPRVSHVYAFDPSPVTGWYSVKDTEQRKRNAEGLEIDRVFEHGEILAYLRLLLSYVYPPSDANPAIRETRYNFVPSGDVISSHSMRQLACDLAQASRQAR